MRSDSVSEGALEDLTELRALIRKGESSEEVQRLFDVITGRLVVLVEMESQFRNETSNPD